MEIINRKNIKEAEPLLYADLLTKVNSNIASITHSITCYVENDVREYEHYCYIDCFSYKGTEKIVFEVIINKKYINSYKNNQQENIDITVGTELTFVYKPEIDYKTNKLKLRVMFLLGIRKAKLNQDNKEMLIKDISSKYHRNTFYRHEIIQKDILKIALLAPRDSQGYHDFVTTLQKNKSHRSNIQINYYSVIFSAKNIQNNKAALNKAIHDYTDIVVIVRGGRFGLNDDLDSIGDYEFKKPIIVGIGHEKDKTILDSISHKSCATPSSAANHIISVRDHNQSENIIRQKNIQINNKNKIISNLKSSKNKLNNTIGIVLFIVLVVVILVLFTNHK